MNISPDGIVGTCNSKCSFSYNYPTSGSTATNSGQFLSISYDQSLKAVNFNGVYYDVTSCSIYSPSLHLYNNVNASAEFVITHSPSTGGELLYVCIPISTSGVSSSASNTIDQIVSAVSSSAPSQGESVTQGIDDFTLNNFIPKNPFYFYSTGVMFVVAFGMQSAIYISPENLTALQDCITENTTNAFPAGYELFVSEMNASLGSPTNGNDIYIDCQPTNESEEQIIQTTTQQPPAFTKSIAKLVGSNIVSFIVFAMAIVVVLYGAIKFIGYLAGERMS
jgi:carbonic anhydrase